jgi:tight adherence protein B
MDIRSLLIILLSVSTVSGGFYILVFPFLSGEAKSDRRHAQIAGRGAGKKGDNRAVDAATRRKQISDSLKDLEKTSAKKKQVTLENRIAQAGLSVPKTHFLIGSAIASVVLALMLYGPSRNPLFALAGLVIGGLGLPRFWLNFMTDRRLKKFSLEFPNSLDIIIRGVKAGLPLGDCMRIIASEASEPVRSEFRQIVESQALGLSVTEAVERMPDRIPTPEANFFAIVIAIQQKAGGNLAEALANLSRVLRERKKMRDKIKAISSEAKASAMIIGALPIVVALLVYITSPRYIELLWTTETGRVVLVVCVCVMGLGCFIMQKMIAFDI